MVRCMVHCGGVVRIALMNLQNETNVEKTEQNNTVERFLKYNDATQTEMQTLLRKMSNFFAKQRLDSFQTTDRVYKPLLTRSSPSSCSSIDCMSVSSVSAN